jgi:hypothetical protein
VAGEEFVGDWLAGVAVINLFAEGISVDTSRLRFRPRRVRSGSNWYLVGDKDLGATIIGLGRQGWYIGIGVRWRPGDGGDGILYRKF